MAELTKEDIRSIFKEVHAEAEKESEPKRDEYRKIIEDTHIAITGDKGLGLKGLAEKVDCLLSYKPELKLVRWIKKTSIYLFVAGLVTLIGVAIRSAYKWLT